MVATLQVTRNRPLPLSNRIDQEQTPPAVSPQACG